MFAIEESWPGRFVVLGFASMHPMLLGKRVEGHHALPVSHDDLGCFGVDLLATSDKRTFLLLPFLPGGSIGHLPEELSGSGLFLLWQCIHHFNDPVTPAVGTGVTRTQKLLAV